MRYLINRESYKKHRREERERREQEKMV
jgi:hypothetical protein